MTEPGRLRLVELLGSLSMATDTVMGQPMGHGIRTSLVATEIAERLGLPPDRTRHVQQVALLRFLGCTAEATALSRDVGGDEISFYRAVAPVLNAGKWETLRGIAPAMAPGRPRLSRLGTVARMAVDTEGDRTLNRSHCEVAAMLATRLDLHENVVEALSHAFERWDGQGSPDGLVGEDVPIEVRISTVARDVDVAVSSGEDVTELMRSRSGKAYDPAVADAVIAFDITSPETDWGHLLASEPEPFSVIDDTAPVLEVMADFADLKSPWTRGHSRRVADLVVRAATAAGMDHAQVERLRGAALVHDLGKVGIENGIWDKPGPLSLDEWERVRLHPYLTERILTRCEYLATLAETAIRHHEQLDGTGYHGRLAASQLTTADRLLAVSSAFVAMTSERPHRPAMTRDEAGAALEKGVEEGAFDGEAVATLLHVEGMATARAMERPAGLTARELEVLRLIVREKTNRQIADSLFISPKTVGRHVENIYSKIGVTTRAGAAVFAMEHGLHD